MQGTTNQSLLYNWYQGSFSRVKRPERREVYHLHLFSMEVKNKLIHSYVTHVHTLSWGAQRQFFLQNLPLHPFQLIRYCMYGVPDFRII